MANPVRPWLLLALSPIAPGQDLVVGSKAFTESRLLAEIFVQAIEAETDLVVAHKNIGGTLLCLQALREGHIDLYPEYTGTAWAEILGEPDAPGGALETFLTVMTRCRDELDLAWLPPLGLNNSYALAVRRETAEQLGLARISDLAAHRHLRAGFSVEFVHRPDGWAGLAPTYGLELASVNPMEHSLAYEALASGDIDLIDAYTTDAKLRRYDLSVLEDDRAFFPPYHAAPLVSGATLRAHPELRGVLEDLAFTLTDEVAVELNHRVEVGGEDFASVAADFLSGRVEQENSTEPRAISGITQRVLEHLWLTLLSVLFATAIALPLGIAATRSALLKRASLSAASILQTIPSLALLAMLITLPGLGLDTTTAVVALFLYALLPILRNTVAGLESVDQELLEAARGLGLTPREILLRIQAPLAVGTLVAGIRTATVISIGVATLAAFIGAGGLGTLIVEGLYLNDQRLILAGAIPAALLALAIDALLGRIQLHLTPPGIRT